MTECNDHHNHHHAISENSKYEEALSLYDTNINDEKVS